jgi:hypothetical protein
MTIHHSKRLLLVVAALSLAVLACNASAAPPAPSPTPQFTPYIAPTFTPVYAMSGVTPVTVPVSTNPTPYPPPVYQPTAVAIQPTAVPSGATRIRFAPGTTSASLQSTLYNGGVDRFLLNVEAGQIMTVEVTSRLSISVTAPNGVLVPAAVNNGTFWSGSLPLSGDYTLSIANLGTAINYTVTVAIPLRIAFAPGGTAITETGSLTGPGTRSYVLEASAGQDMTVRLSTSGAAAWLAITAPDGSVLLPTTLNQAAWTGTLPASGDYYITVGLASGTASFSLFASVPQRISFAQGATAATVSGTLTAPNPDAWLIEASANRLMQVMLQAPNGGAWLSIDGVDGTSLLSGNARQTFWSGHLPSTQDYVIGVHSTTGTLNYTLQVTIPVPIRFAAGATSAAVQGQIVANTRTSYVLEARAGQTMSLTLNAPSGGVLLAVVGGDGTPFLRQAAGATTFSFTLPATQEYLVEAVPAAWIQNATFTLSVSIQ